MKVILSRKGFDSKYGGCPSPIFPDGSMFSLPIPSSDDSRCFGEINYGQHNLGQVVESLTKGRHSSTSLTHFDPDLSLLAIPRQPGWLPSLGQVNAALTHLHNQSVEVGDLFLFFGWFDDVEEDVNRLFRHTSRCNNRHVIFGWLQIGEILDVGSDGAAALVKKPWLEKHPHVIGEWSKKNKIYIASKSLNFPTVISAKTIAGGGMFDNITPNRTLTQPGQGNRSLWALPKAFSPENGAATLSYHENSAKWSTSKNPEKILLDSAKIGQEFVLKVSDPKILTNWLSDIFTN